MAAVNVPLTGTTADEQVTTGRGILKGFSVRESAASAAVATALIRDGTTASDPIVYSLELNGDECHSMWFGEKGIRINTGVYLDRVAGTITGSIWME